MLVSEPRLCPLNPDWPEMLLTICIIFFVFESSKNELYGFTLCYFYYWAKWCCSLSFFMIWAFSTCNSYTIFFNSDISISLYSIFLWASSISFFYFWRRICFTSSTSSFELSSFFRLSFVLLCSWSSFISFWKASCSLSSSSTLSSTLSICNLS